MTDRIWNPDPITSIDQVRALVGEPHEMVANKSVACIEQHVRHFLSMSPMFFLSTADAGGRCDTSPRGDEPGFVKPLDDRHLIYPERPGNRRIDSLMNVMATGQVGMLFVIPGMDEVLRINGSATVTNDAELIGRMEWSGHKPLLAVVVRVQECFIHCPRALKQGKLWQTQHWPQADAHPSATEMFKAHLEINGIKA